MNRRGQGGMGRGRLVGPFSAGPCGDCVCPNCGNRIPHRTGFPCMNQTCTKCGARMIRE